MKDLQQVHKDLEGRPVDPVRESVIIYHEILRHAPVVTRRLSILVAE